MNNVRQDGAALHAVASTIREHANSYWNKIEQLYEEVNNTVSAGDDSKAWYGPKAGEFVQAVENCRDQFQQIKTALEQAAQNLDDQANAWDNFENA